MRYEPANASRCNLPAVQITDAWDGLQGFPITCFLWDKPGLRLFASCNGGCVSQTVLRAGMSALFGSTDTELLLKEETGIVQVRFAFVDHSEMLGAHRWYIRYSLI